MEKNSTSLNLTRKKVVALLLLLVFSLIFIFSCTCSVLPFGRMLVGTFGYLVFPLSLILAFVSLAIFLGFSYRRRIKPTVFFIFALALVLLAIHAIATFKGLNSVVNAETLKNYLAASYTNFNLLGALGSTICGVLAFLLGGMGVIVLFVIAATIFIGLFIDYHFYGKYEKPHIKMLKTHSMREKVNNSDAVYTTDGTPTYSFNEDNKYNSASQEVMSEITVDAKEYENYNQTNTVAQYRQEDVVGEISNEMIDEKNDYPDPIYTSFYTQNSNYQNNNNFSDDVREVNISDIPDVYDYDAYEKRRQFMNATFGNHEQASNDEISSNETINSADYSANQYIDNAFTEPQVANNDNYSQLSFATEAANAPLSADYSLQNNEVSSNNLSEEEVSNDELNNDIDNEISKILNTDEDEIDNFVKSDFNANLSPVETSSNGSGIDLNFAESNDAANLTFDKPIEAEETSSNSATNFANENILNLGSNEQINEIKPEVKPSYEPSNEMNVSGFGLNLSNNSSDSLSSVNLATGQQNEHKINENVLSSPNTFGANVNNFASPKPENFSKNLATSSPVNNSINSSLNQQTLNNNTNFVNNQVQNTNNNANMHVVPSVAQKKSAYSFNIGLPGVRYNPPPLSLLRTPLPDNGDYTEEQQRKSAQLENVLAAFNIPAKVKNIVRGPKITRYELSVPLGVSVKKIPMFENDIAAALAAKTIVIKAPIPGSSFVGIELENDTFSTVYERELLESDEFQNFKEPLPIAIGKDISGEIVVKSLAKMVHLLIAGSTGSGKSVFIHNIVVSLIYKHSPDELRLIMIDPKKVEFNRYNGLPHLLTPEVVMGADKAINALKWSVKEMQRRYDLLSKAGFNHIEPYNKSELVKSGQFEKLPYIVIIVDELAEIMLVNKKEVESCIQSLTQLARACGMHIILATQRPSVDIISGVIKNNIPSRIAFSLQSGIDSKTILNSVGAEKLLGQGDMIFAPTGTSATPRLQAAYATDDEIKAVIDYDIKYNNANYDESVNNIINAEEQPEEATGMGADGIPVKNTVDGYFKTAVKLVMQNGGASVSYLQRRLSIGYSRAARIIDQMEDCGYIAGATGAKVRQVLITPDKFKQDFGEDFNDIND